MRVKAGDAYADALGRTWATGTFSGGTTEGGDRWAPVANTGDPALYKTERANPGTFATTLPNGTYTVTLKFVEMWATAPGQRLFHVAVQGTQVLSSFDVFAAAGRQYAAVDRSFPATVTDGTLTVGFTPVVDSAIVSAIEVLPADPPSWASASVVYRGDGLRASKTAGGATTSYAWDLGAGLPVVLQDGANSYVYGAGGSLISQTDATGTQTYALADGLGSTRALTDGAGTVTATYAYDAFGALRASTGTAATEFRFAGQQDDPALGYQYLRARYYDPSTGRFISKDPVGGIAARPGTHHRYVYGLNNPANLTDPTGNFPSPTEAIESVLNALAEPAYAPAEDGQDGDLASSIARAQACGTGGALPGIGAAEDVVMVAGLIIPGAGELDAAANVPQLGRKLDFLFGLATGTKHNIDRSRAMAGQLNRTGLADSQASRAYVAEHFTQVLRDASNIVETQANGRVVRESLLMGPLGGLKVQSIWDGAKLITAKLYGG